MGKWRFVEGKPYIFVSYKREDKEVVEECIETLYNMGINIWYDKDLTAGNKWDDEAKPKLRDKDCKGVIFFGSVEALTSENIELELETANNYKKKIIPINFNKKNFSDLVQEDILDKYNQTDPKKVDVAENMVKEYLPDKLTFLVWNQEGFYEELIRSLKNNTKYFDKESSDAGAAKNDNAIAKEKEAVGKEKSDNRLLEFSIYGEDRSGNHSDFIIISIGKILKKHPEMIDAAVEEFPFLSYEDWSGDKENAPSYLKACAMVRISEDKNICIGTNMILDMKLKAVAKVIRFVGESEDILKIKGLELPNVSEGGNREAFKPSNEIYTLFGEEKTGSQAQMVYDVFENLTEKYPDRIEGLLELSTIARAKDVIEPLTRNAKPAYFRAGKAFRINGEDYYVGTSTAREIKIKEIKNMLKICGAPEDAFELIGDDTCQETGERKKNAHSKKTYDI